MQIRLLSWSVACGSALALVATGTAADLPPRSSQISPAAQPSQPRAAAYTQHAVLQESGIQQMAGEEEDPAHVKPSVFLSVDKLPAGQTCRVAIVLDVEAGWHINTNPASPAFLVPTNATMKSSQGTALKDLKFPPGAQLVMEGIDEPIHVYEGRTILVGTLQVPAGAVGHTEEMQIEVKLQTCNEENCLQPQVLKLKGKLAVAAPQAVSQINQNLFAEADKHLAANTAKTQKK